MKQEKKTHIDFTQRCTKGNTLCELTISVSMMSLVTSTTKRKNEHTRDIILTEIVQLATNCDFSTETDLCKPPGSYISQFACNMNLVYAFIYSPDDAVWMYSKILLNRFYQWILKHETSRYYFSN